MTIILLFISYPVYLIIVVEEKTHVLRRFLKTETLLLNFRFFVIRTNMQKQICGSGLASSSLSILVIEQVLFFIFSINNFLDSWGLDEMIFFFNRLFINWNFHLSTNPFFPFNWNREEKIVQNTKTNISSNFDAFKFIAILASRHLQTMTFRIENGWILIRLSSTF